MEENNSYYWNGLEEFEKTPEYQKSLKDEFKEDIPVIEEALSDDTLELKSSRRGFLKAFGFGIGAASLAACETPVRKAIPYVIKPENVTPGVPSYYATTCGGCAAGCALLVKSREGRPIKIEGNLNSPLSKGGTCAVGQSTVLNLYDSERLQAPQIDGKDVSWGDFDSGLASAMGAAGGKTVVLTGTINSPTTQKIINDFLAATGGGDHVMYDAASVYAIRKAHQNNFGKKVLPAYDFSKAEVVVSFGADFLGTWISPVEFTKGYTSMRKLNAKNPEMSKHYQFEGLMSLTGSNADERVPVAASDEGKALLKLYSLVSGEGGGGSVSPAIDAKLAAAAKALKGAAGKSLVLCGTNDVASQEVVNAINNSLGNYGTTLNIDKPSYQAMGDDEAMYALTQEMKAGSVGNLIMIDVNPAYDYAEAEAFTAALKSVKNVVALSNKKDETAQLAKYIGATNHYLESWGDSNPKEGLFGLQQPLIRPLFDTRSATDTLLTWTAALAGGEAMTTLEAVQAYWKTNLHGGLGVFRTFWEGSLKKGVYTGAQPAMVEAEGETEESDSADEDEVVSTGGFSGDVAALAGALSGGAGSGMDVILFQKVGIRAGKWANNPWLQELPDPITKVTWDQCVSVSYNHAQANNLKDGDMVAVSAGGNSVKLPVLVVPGQSDKVLGLPLGYGRTAAGVTANGIGQNTAGLADGTKGAISYVVAGGSLSTPDGKTTLAKTQYYMGYEMAERGNSTFDALTRQATEERVDDFILKDTTLGEYQANRKAGNENRDTIQHHNHINLWDEHPKEGHWWAMSIDLNSCTGCGNCVVACHSENNVPMVGKKEVATRREMHWMRIDRYFKGHPGDQNGNLQVGHQPMMCQHCDNAPCETVCPVLATVHSDEGLNQQVYNRCIGTRYCANNCPYKVRRFNWFSYYSNDRLFNNPETNAPNRHMFDDYGRMALNPDVTVRARGVMEKCSMCVQRIQLGKLEAKVAKEPLKDGAIQTACQQTCPADAIVFGDLNNKESEVFKQYFDNERIYHALEEVKTLPSVSYMTKVRNTDEPESKNNSASHSEAHS